MPNTVLNPSIIAKAAVRILDNELVMANRVYRAYEEEFAKKVNGYEAGDTISIRKPAQFPVRSTIVAPASASIGDVTEGKLTMTVDQVRGVDFKFSSTELTLKIEELAERVIKPAMVRLANAVDQAVMAEYFRVPNWVGVLNAGLEGPIDSFAKFARGAERLDQYAVPSDDRVAVLSPESYWAMAGSQTALFPTGISQPAYRKGRIGEIGGVDTYMSQNVPTFVPAVVDNLATVTGTQSTTYANVLNTESVPGSMSLVTGGWSVSSTVAKGAVFVIAGVRAVNPVTKAVLPFLQHFTVLADAATDGAGAATLTITPAIIPVGAAGGFETTDLAAIGGAVITCAGGGSPNAYRQNLMFHKNAFALAVVPLVKPPGAVDVARESYKGLSVRLIPYYDGTNDVSSYRLDVLFGVKTVDPRMAVRISGSAPTTGAGSI